MRGSWRVCISLVFGLVWGATPLEASTCDLLLRQLHGLTSEEFLEGAGVSEQVARSKPITLHLFDFDDNVAHIDSSRIFARNWTTGEEVALTTREYAEARNEMGKEGGPWEGTHFFDYVVLPGEEPRLITTEERYEIQAQLGQEGPYKDAKIVDGSWWHFRDVPDAQIFDKHLATAVDSDTHWQGPAFFPFAVALGEEDSANWTGILTTRGHRPESFVRAIESEFVAKGFAQNNVRQELVFPIYSPNFPDAFGPRPQERKATVLTSLMDLLERVPLKNARDRHRIVYSEDDQNTIAHARKLIEEGLAEGRWTRVEIEIQNTQYSSAEVILLSPEVKIFVEPTEEGVDRVRQSLAALGFEGKFVIPSGVAQQIASKLDLSMEDLLLHLIPIAKSYASPSISNYHVGVAGMTYDGDVYLGVNLEYEGQHLNHTVHGEQFLIANMLMNGGRSLKSIALSAAPCGHCRQFMYEIEGGHNIEIIVTGQPSRKLPEVLVDPFGPRDLGLESGLLGHGPNALELVEDQIDDLLILYALDAAQKSYAPYTKSYAGVVIELEDRSIYSGSYIENAAFNPSLSPMQVALVAMHMEHRRPDEIARVMLAETPNAKSSALPSARELLDSIAPGVEILRIEVEAK